MKKYSYIVFRWIGIIGYAAYLAGCSESATENHDGKYLIQVGKTHITVLDFNRAFDSERASYPYDITQNPEFLSSVRLEFLKQMIEKMILLERAREIHLEISDKELENAIGQIRADYSEEEFEQALLKSAISYNTWKSEVKDRLLMEKLVTKEMGKETAFTAEDMERYYEDKRDNPDGSEETAEGSLRSSDGKKRAEAYHQWIQKLQKKYPIRIDEEQWKKICAK